jgi:hypothetical protein
MKTYLSLLLTGAMIIGASVSAFGETKKSENSGHKSRNSHHKSTGSHKSGSSGSKTKSNVPSN